MANNSKEISAKEGGSGWKDLAWQAWLSGERNISQLSKQFDKGWETVKKAIADKSEQVQAALG